MSASDIVVGPIQEPWPEAVMQPLKEVLSVTSDVAFAHLVEAGVPGQGEVHPALFVWLRPEALRALNRVLNQVSSIVSRALPEGYSVDVIVLNSAPELLETVDGAGGLIVESDPEERRRALDAAAALSDEDHANPLQKGRWWWPF